MTEAQSTTAIELHSIRHVYANIVAVDDVSLTVPSGSTVALIGPDGVGKSTLMALIAGVKRIQSGKLTALGADMTDQQSKAAGNAENRIHAAGAWKKSLYSADG